MCVTERVPVVRTSESKDDEEMMANNLSPDAVLNLDHGDPTVFETFWRSMGDKCTVVIPGYQSLSYFADAKNLCWFLEPKLEESIKNLHHMVGNAVVEDRHIVVGTGSSQLVQAVLYALSPPDQPEPMTVVCAAPYYSCYKEVTEFLQSGLYKWGGDAFTFDKGGPYIEMVTSPNNPDGVCRQAVVNRDGGKLVHDLAYYWPQYTAITAPADYDIMLFTVSKCTGHAGSRIGWAVVKDKEVAKRMIKYIEVNTIGVSKESQHRAAKLLEVITPKNGWVANNFFVYTQNVMANRWEKLRNVINDSPHFSLAKYPLRYCNFTREFAQQVPAFAWIKCKDNTEDCAELFKEHKILTRSGTRFGVDAKFARVSMVGREEEFNLFIERLCAMNKLQAA